MLRGINVSGQKMIRMQDLQALYESLKLTNVRTYVQSGNVVFDSKEKDSLKLTKLIENKIEKTFSFSVTVFIRDAKNLKRIIDNNPFAKRNEDSKKLYVTFLYSNSVLMDKKNLDVPNNDSDEYYLGEEEIYIFCPNGYGRTKLNNNFFERKLKMPATTRNWNTVSALYEMAIDGK